MTYRKDELELLDLLNYKKIKKLYELFEKIYKDVILYIKSRYKKYKVSFNINLGLSLESYLSFYEQ